jgi:hypothetical protein
MLSEERPYGALDRNVRWQTSGIRSRRLVFINYILINRQLNDN